MSEVRNEASMHFTGTQYFGNVGQPGYLQQLDMPLISAQLIEGKIEIVRRIPSNIMFASNPPRKAPDGAIKEVYGVVDGEIKLVQTIDGTIIPEEIIPESIKWQQ